MLDRPSGFSVRDALKATGALLLLMAGAEAAITVLFEAVKWITDGAQLATPAWVATDNPVFIEFRNVAGFALALLYALRTTNDSWRNLLRSPPTSSRVVISLLVAIAGLRIITSEISSAMNHAMPVPASMLRSHRQLIDLALHPISSPFSLMVVAPITEELFFRGLILRRLLASHSVVRSVAISAALFMAIHLNRWQFPGALGAGVLLGWIYVRTRSLWLCIAGHAFANGCVLLAPGLPFVIRGFNAPEPAGAAVFQPWWFDVFGAVLLGVGLFALHRVMPPLGSRPTTAQPPGASAEPAQTGGVRTTRDSGA